MLRAFLALLVAFAVLAAPASADARKAPEGAAFYTPPKHLHGKHGGLIWARRQKGSDALKGARRNTLLLYRSKGLSGSLTAVSGSLAIPKGKPPKGGWPVITYAHGTTGSADACAPTRGYDAGSLVSYAYPLLKRWLKAGYAVVRTDYDGLGTPGVHGYLVGRSEGGSVLDAVRAARAFDHRLSKRFVIAGHSQGAMRRCSRPRWRRSGCRTCGCAARSRSRRRRTWRRSSRSRSGPRTPAAGSARSSRSGCAASTRRTRSSACRSC
ncbi:MAG TPA: lipase family protein [Solirubrobacteraceae bacterium]|nr:lipase family protein [Solirubrobacteraceae bacterium]